MKSLSTALMFQAITPVVLRLDSFEFTFMRSTYATILNFERVKMLEITSCTRIAKLLDLLSGRPRVIVFGESNYAQHERRRHHTRDQIYFPRTNGREQWYHKGEDHIMALQVTWSHLVNIIPVGLVDVALEDFEFWSAKEVACKTGWEVKV